MDQKDIHVPSVDSGGSADFPRYRQRRDYARIRERRAYEAALAAVALFAVAALFAALWSMV